MKILRIFLPVAALVLMFTSAAFGNSVNDPKIIIHGANGGGVPAHCPPEGCQDVGTKFSFTSPAKGSGALFFTNASGKNWTSLTLVEKGVPAADISCGTSLFTSCSIKTLKNGAVEILLSGVKGAPNQDKGILAGQSFVIDFACVNQNCWPKGGITFNAKAGTSLKGVVPEPTAMLLLGTGLLGIYSQRKRWKKRIDG